MEVDLDTPRRKVRRHLGRAYPVDVLGSARLMSFIPVTDIARSRTFYETTLGLSVVDDGPFALVVDANGTMVRITPVPDLQPQPFTIAGWQVGDIEATVDELVARGVTFNRYEGMEQAANGIWASPSGDLVAWFVDPDGNTLSLTQFGLE
jgi:catechol 2,3-dioxygenase-like lactoylglutathione lyase family enzyme